MANPLPKGLQKRGAAYYTNFRVNGQHIRRRLASDRRTAEAKLIELRSRLERGDYGLVDNNYSWAELKAEFLAWVKQTKRPSTARDYGQNLAIFEQYATPQNIREITHERIVLFREARLAEAGRNNEAISPRTINKQIATLQTMFNKAVEWQRIGSNPISGITPLTHDAPKKERRPLSADEVCRVFEASGENLYPVWRMLLTTGMRSGELTNLKFSDIDFQGRTATVRATNAKNKKARDIPLDDETLEMIARLHAEAKRRKPVKGNTPKQTEQQRANFSRENVFVTQVNTPHRNNLLKKFYAICQRAGIEGAEPNGSVDIHAQRGSFISNAISNGASPKAVQKIVGHASLAMTMNTYAKANDRSKREAIGKLSWASASSPSHIIEMHQSGANTAQVHSPRTQTQTMQRTSAV